MSTCALELSPPGAQLCAALLNQGLRVRVRVNGSSMRPGLVDGDVVHLAPTRSELIKPGDILFIQDPLRGYYLHRLLLRPRVNGRILLQTRGDSHWRLDEPVGSQQVLARVTSIEQRPTGPPRHWLWRAGSHHLLARLELMQSACYYLLNRLNTQLQNIDNALRRYRN